MKTEECTQHIFNVYHYDEDRFEKLKDRLPLEKINANKEKLAA